MAPLEVLNPTSPFGLRTSPLSGVAGEFHWGQDFAAACGTRVYAADAGVVRAVGWHPWGGGNRVEIDHGNGLITTYNHLEGIAVKKGDSVRVGEVIAKVGTTGSSTGCHLHFETILNGVYKNPMDWTLLPITQADPLGPLEMTSYAPDAGMPTNASLGWAIPVSEDRGHQVANGAQEITGAKLPQLPGYVATLSPAPSSTAVALPSSRPSSSATGQASGTSAPAPSSPVTAAPPPATKPPATTPPANPEPPVTPSPHPTSPPAQPPATQTPPPVATPPSGTGAPGPVATLPPVTTPAPEPTAPPVTTGPAPSGPPVPTATVTAVPTPTVTPVPTATVTP